MEPRSYPSVSVVLPIRDEGDCIVEVLEAVLAQDYPGEVLEIVVVDGDSDDDTPALVEALAVDHPTIRLMHNPDRIVPISLNLAIPELRGELIARVDGHCFIPTNYLTRCAELIAETGAACVGGSIISEGVGRVARAIARAQSSPFGAGDAAFRTGRGPVAPVDTVAFPVFRREVFDTVGLFDPELVRNQDDEFSFRLRQAGEEIWIDPAVRSRYRVRGRFRDAWRQYHGYGRFKVLVIAKRGELPPSRALAPTALVAGLVAPVALAAATRRPSLALAGVVPYGLGLLGATVIEAKRSKQDVALLPVALASLHLGYGTGFLRGLVNFGSRLRD